MRVNNVSHNLIDALNLQEEKSQTKDAGPWFVIFLSTCLFFEIGCHIDS